MSAITDDQLAQLIAAWRDGALSASQQQEWAQRLADDPTARQEFIAQVRMSAAIEIFSTAASESTGEAIWQAVERRACASASGARRIARTVKAVDSRLDHRWWMVPTWSALAALLVLGLMTWWAVQSTRKDPAFWQVDGRPIAEAEELLGGASGLALHATDGSTVHLSSGAIAVVSKNLIEVRLGEVRAHISHRGSGKPLVFTTLQARTVVLGTVLTVATGPRDTVVAVESGQVRVTTATDTMVVNTGESVIASRGDGAAPTLRPAIARHVGTMEPATALADAIGVNVHVAHGLPPYDRFDELVLPRLRELGVRHVRDGISGRMAELAPQLHAAGLGLTASVDVDEDVTGLADRLASIAGCLDAVEGPNASDQRKDGPYASATFYRGAGFPEGTVAFTRDLVMELRRRPATQSVPFIAPSVGDRMRTAELGTITHLDFANVDAMAGALSPQAAFLAADPAAARVVAGGRLPVVTAMGWHTHTTAGDRIGRVGVDESTQATMIVALALGVSQLPARRAFLYQLCDGDFAGDAPGENAYGILRSDGAPKPAFHALARVLALADSNSLSTAALTDEPVLRVMADPAVRTRLLACADGRRLVALWSDRIAGGAVLALPTSMLEPRPWRIRSHQPVSGAVRELDVATLIILPDPMDPQIVELIPPR